MGSLAINPSAVSVLLSRYMDVTPTRRVEYHSVNRTHTGLPWLTGVSVLWSKLLAFRLIAPTNVNFRQFSTWFPESPGVPFTTDLQVWYIRETPSRPPTALGIYSGRSVIGRRAFAALPRRHGPRSSSTIFRHIFTVSRVFYATCVSHHAHFVITALTWANPPETTWDIWFLGRVSETTQKLIRLWRVGAVKY